jgi:hypothetical protein
MRTALDAGNPKAAIAALNQELGVATEKDQPKSVNGDDALLVLDRATKRVISAPGGSEPIYLDGRLQPLSQTQPVFKHGHDLYVDSEGDIYLGEWNAERRYPSKLSLVR